MSFSIVHRHAGAVGHWQDAAVGVSGGSTARQHMHMLATARQLFERANLYIFLLLCMFAGMSELWATGWMQQSVRMVA
jgi:hypothetical protein